MDWGILSAGILVVYMSALIIAIWRWFNAKNKILWGVIALVLLLMCLSEASLLLQQTPGPEQMSMQAWPKLLAALLITFALAIAGNLPGQLASLKLVDINGTQGSTNYFGHCEYDVEHDAITWSDEVFNIYGLSRSNFTPSIDAILQRVHPADQQMLRDSFEAILREGRPLQEEFRIIRPDGEPRIIREHTIAISESEHEPSKLVTTIYDVTAHTPERELIHRFGQILDSSFNEIYLFDAKTLKFVHCNHTALLHTGYTFSELYKLTPLALKPAYSREEFEALIAPLRNQEIDKLRFETEHRRKDGSLYPVYVNLQYLSIGQPMVFVAIICDISEQKSATELMLQRDAQLTHAMRLATMGEMATGIAHEINQPLSAIINYAKGGERRLVENPDEPAAIKEALQQIVEQAERAAGIISRIRNFVRKKDPHRSTVEVNELVNYIAKLIKTAANANAVQIMYKLDDDLPTILADPVQIEQVLLNISMNAIEVMAEMDNGARILTFKTSLADKDSLHVCVHNTGPRLDEQDLERVFEAFYTTKSQGMGIGLSLSRTIIETHGGKMWARSGDMVANTEFCFSLPVNKSQDVENGS